MYCKVYHRFREKSKVFGLSPGTFSSLEKLLDPEAVLDSQYLKIRVLRVLRVLRDLRRIRPNATGIQTIQQLKNKFASLHYICYHIYTNFIILSRLEAPNTS